MGTQVGENSGEFSRYIKFVAFCIVSAVKKVYTNNIHISGISRMSS